MTIVLDGVDVVPTESEVAHAGWPARAAALAIDVLPAVAVIATMALLGLSTPQWGVLWWTFTVVAVLAGLAAVVNRWALPSLTGWTLGRSLFGIRVVIAAGTPEAVPAEGTPAGGVRLFLRDVAHLLDTLSLFVGWLWPPWDRRGRTFADMLAGTEVAVVTRPERDVRRTAGLVCLVAALLCVAGSGLGYQLDYRHDRAVEAARDQIASQGPRMVEQMLSYGATTQKDDFARSQERVTESYRPQLAAQQQVAEKAGGTTNEYWSTNSAVLADPPVTPDSAAMLLALQGQRGTDPKQLKFISATVRVDFQKVDGDWRIANLTVLKKPTPSEAGG